MNDVVNNILQHLHSVRMSLAKRLFWADGMGFAWVFPRGCWDARRPHWEPFGKKGSNKSGNSASFAPLRQTGGGPSVLWPTPPSWFGRVSEASWMSLGVSGMPLGGLLEASWGLLGRRARFFGSSSLSRVHLGAFFEPFEHSWAALGPS